MAQPCRSVRKRNSALKESATSIQINNSTAAFVLMDQAIALAVPTACSARRIAE